MKELTQYKVDIIMYSDANIVKVSMKFIASVFSKPNNIISI